MIRLITFLTFTLLTSFIFAQEDFSFVLKGQIFNTDSDTLKLLQNNGENNLEIAVVEMDEKGFFEKSRSEEHTSELQSRPHLVCRLLLEKKKKTIIRVSRS